MKTFKEFIEELNEDTSKISPALLKKIRDDVEKKFTIYGEKISNNSVEFLPSTEYSSRVWNDISKFSREMNIKYKKDNLIFKDGDFYYYVPGSGVKGESLSSILVILTAAAPVKKGRSLTQKQLDDIRRTEKEMENRNDAARKRDKGEY